MEGLKTTTFWKILKFYNSANAWEGFKEKQCGNKSLLTITDKQKERNKKVEECKSYNQLEVPKLNNVLRLLKDKSTQFPLYFKKLYEMRKLKNDDLVSNVLPVVRDLDAYLHDVLTTDYNDDWPTLRNKYRNELKYVETYLKEFQSKLYKFQLKINY